VPFDEGAAGELDRLRGIKEARGIGHADLLIASIALARRAVLVTRNRRHFVRIPGLSVVNWVDGPAPP
jgi:tRNA(fMet)-specific endonuclease VapC